MYARSAGNEIVTQEQLQTAALEVPSVIILGSDKFTFSHRRYDVARADS